MRVAIYSTKGYEREIMDTANKAHGHEFVFLDVRLTALTAPLAEGCACAAIFANDDASAPSLEGLHRAGVRLLALRSAGFNHVDLEAADRLGVTALRVPAYSPYSVAEHAVALILSLNRKTHRAYSRVREQNFNLAGLMGFDLHGKTVGVLGTGKIGRAFARIMLGFGCRVIAHDPYPNDELAALGVEYVPLETLWRESRVLSIHCPLTPRTHHLVNERSLAMMPEGVMLINTSRGGVVDTRAAIRALKSGHIGALGLDVYEEEGDLFFRDLSDKVIQDDVFVRLMTFPNVLITAHQGFFTKEAITNIADTTLQNITDFERGEPNPDNLVTLEKLVASAS